MSVSVTLKSYFYEVLIPSSQKNTSSPIEDILHHVSISFMKKLALYKCFNPRTHTGCDGSSPRLPLRSKCFNPRTHTGCDARQLARPEPDKVSIHAPTRGATNLLLEDTGSTNVSIHAPTRGATPLYLCIYKTFTFQSTHPHGVRLCMRNLLCWEVVCFNPRTHTGCDHAEAGTRRQRQGFNPRTHTGCDFTPETVFHELEVSIHAPTRGATAAADVALPALCALFQSTHPHGVRQCAKLHIISQ